jgi:hypothetical protein
LDLDVLSFDALCASVQRIKASDRLDMLWLMRIAVNAEAKDFKKIANDLGKQTTSGTSKLPPGVKTGEDFKREFGRGF